MEIVYCVDCGKKLRDHDFVRCAAYTREKRHYCTSCRPLDPQAIPAPKPKTTRAMKVKPAKSNGRWIAAAVAGFVMAALGAVLLFSGKPPPQPAPEIPAPRPRPVIEAPKLPAGPTPAVAWDFEMLSGDVFTNRGGELYAAVRVAGVDQAEGVVGKALRLNGKSFLRIDGADVFNAPDLTVAFWIKPMNVKGRQGLLSKRTDNKQSPFVLSLWDGALSFEAADESHQWTCQVKSVAVVKSDAWSHVGVVARSGRGVDIYLNGELLHEFKSNKRRCRNSDPMFVGREMYNGSDAHDGTAFYA